MKYIMAALFTVLTFQQAQADLECPGKVQFADEMEIPISKNKTVDVFLNGVGKQSYLFINIFYGALYLEDPTSDDKAIISSKEYKLFTIHALMNLTEDQLIEQWDMEYEKQCEDQCEKLRPYHEQFLSYARDVAKGERMSLAFHPDRLVFISPTNEMFPPVKSPAYGAIMLKAAIGDNPIGKKLKDGLLGKDKKLCKEI